MEIQFVSVDGRPIDRTGEFNETWFANTGENVVDECWMEHDADSEDEAPAEAEDHEREQCGEFDVLPEYQVLMYPKVQRGRKQAIPDDVLEAVERQKLTKTETILTPFGQREFSSFGEFHSAWEAYEGEHWLNYRIRDAAKVETHNNTMAKRKTKKWEPVPAHMEYGTRTYRCIHGLYQQSRSTGERNARVTRYTACDARIVVEARRSASPSNPWVVQVVTEVVRHNHKCSNLIFDSYTSASVKLADADLFKDLHLMLQVSASTTRIRDVIRMRYGVRLTAQEIANFMRDRLGGRSALANLRLLLQRFSSFEGSRCLIIEDEDGLVCGIVLQSRPQRMMFERFGDNLILDWTHNTNNAGYYLGALMATSASGSGVSVLDFLCLAQTKDMMRTVFTHFVSWNPGALEKIRSFVIDKDYAEWMVLKEMFPTSRVLFCQFHVIKWLVQVVQEGKYGRLAVPLQDSVITVLRAMVYAQKQEAFASQKWLLEHMLSVECPLFIEYMAECWYSCSDMWTDCERGTVFTATNTTSNRIESSWGQVKSILGLKLRFDMCLEAVFTYETAVFEREIECVKPMVGPTSLLRSTSDRFMRPVLAQVSDYCSARIEEQYTAHLRMIGNYFVMQEPGSPDRFVVEKYTADGSHRVVDTSNWSCSCIDFVTCELPCRHMIFVSRVHKQHEFLPLAVLRTRWMLSSMVSMLPELRACTDQLQSLRTGLLLVDPSTVVPDSVPGDASLDDDLAFMSINPTNAQRQLPSVAHVRLARGEKASGVVLDNLEKRNVVEAAFQQIQTYMMAQSSPRFKSMAAYLREMLDGLLVAFKDIPLTDEDRVEEAISAAMRKCELSPQDLIRAMVETAVEADSMQLHRPLANDTLSSAPAPAFAESVRTHHDGVAGGGEVDDANARLRPIVDNDHDDVSSLSMSCASAVLQDAAVRHAESLGGGVLGDGAVSSDPVQKRRFPLLVLPTASRITKRSAAAAQLDSGILEKVTIQGPLSSGKSKTQRARGKLKGSRRMVHITQRSECAVDLDELVGAARATSGVSTVYRKLSAYPLLFNDDWLQKRGVVVDTEHVRASSFTVNFTIPAALFHRLEAAVKSAKESRPAPVFLDLNAPPLSDQFVARIEAATTVRGFSDDNIASIRAYYTALKSCEAYVLDVAWISRNGNDLPTETSEEVLGAIERCALDTRFQLSANNHNPPTSIALHDVVGHLAGDSWLNDTVLVFVLRQIADEIDGLLVLVSLRPVLGANRPLYQLPPQRMLERQVIVFPVNVSKSHWCQIFVTVSRDEGACVTFYDPQAKKSNIETLRDEWMKQCEPFVRAWCVRDRGEYTVSAMEVLATPRQPAHDSNSCGVYCIATTCDFATRSMRFRSMATLTPQLVSYLRLNFMRSILCASVIETTVNEEWAATVMQRLEPKKN